MATYIDYESGTAITITGVSEGYTIKLPSEWSIKQIQQYLAEMQEFVS